MDSETAFDFTKAKITQVAQKVDKKPYFKLLFLSVAIMFSSTWAVSMGVSYFRVGMEKNEIIRENLAQKSSIEKEAALKAAEGIKISEKERQDAIHKQQLQAYNELVGNVKKISQDDATKFFQYLKEQRSFYDSRVALVKESLLGAQKLDYKQSLDGMRESEKLSLLLNDYQQRYDRLIVELNGTYLKVLNDNKTIDPKSLEDFLQSYVLYKSGLFTRSLDFEKVLISYLYVKNKSNVKYNMDNDIITKYENLFHNIKAIDN